MWELALHALGVGLPNTLKLAGTRALVAPGAFALTYSEAEYLQGRLLSIDGPQSLFAYLAGQRGPTLEAPRLWEEPTVEQAPPHVRDDVRLAETFSAISHGANLLYNYLVARKYELDGWTTVENPVEHYESRPGEPGGCRAS